MRTTFKVLAYILAAEVVVQAMAIAFGIAGFGKWIDDGHTATKAVIGDNSKVDFGGKAGFAIHGLNGMMVIPVVVLLLLIVSFMSKVPGASKRAGILLGLVVLQVVLGIASHGAPAIIVLHVLNAFVIFVLAAVTAYHLGDQVSSRAVPAERVSV